MSLWKKAFALTLLTAMPIAGYSVCVSTWTGGLNGDWNQAANWSSCIPGIPVTATDSATFGSTVGASSTISLDTVAITPGLNQLIFDNAATSFTIFSNANFLQFNGANSSIDVLAGGHVILSPVHLNNTLVNVSTSGVLVLLKPVTEAVASTSSMELNGPGELLNELNIIDIAGNFSVFSGTLMNLNVAPVASGQGSLIQTGLDFIVNGGTAANTNTGVVTGGRGVFLHTSQAFTFNGGTVIETNTNTVTGGTAEGAVMQGDADLTVNGGTVTISNSSTVSNGGNGCFLGVPSGFINGGVVTIANSGPISTQGAGSFFSLLDLTINNGLVTNSNTGSVTNNFSIGSFIATLTNLTVNGGTLKNTNTGTTSLNGIGALIESDGIFAVNGGIFINDATVWTPTLNVGPVGTVAGSGLFQNINRVQTTQFANAGTVIPGGPGPGDAPGVMTIQGSYTQSGTLVVNLLNPSAFSQLIVTSANAAFRKAQLAGNLEVAFSKGAKVLPGQTFAILQANHGVTGTFSDLINFNIPNLLPHVEYFPTFVLLSFTPIATTYINYLETLFASNNHINIHLGRQMQQLRGRFSPTEVTNREIKEEKSKRLFFLAQQQQPSSSQISPQFTACADISSPMNNQLAFFKFRPTEEKQEQLRRVVAEPQEECAERHPWNFYLGPTGDLGHVFTKKDSTGFNYWSAGALTGFDYAFSQVGLGLLLNYDHIAGHGAHHWGKFNIDELHANLYATYAPRSLPEFAMNAILGGGYDWYSIHRNTGIETIPEVAKGKPRGAEFDALFGLEYAIQDHGMPERLQIIPLVSIQYIHLNVQKYREHGAGLFDLKFASQTAKSLRSTLGTRINYSWEWTNVVFTPELNLGWQREFFDKSRHVRFVPADFDVPSANLTMPRSGRDVALAGVDFLVTFFDKYSLEASYDFEWNSLYHDHFFYLGCNFRF